MRRTTKIRLVFFLVLACSFAVWAGQRDVVVIRPGGPVVTQDTQTQVTKLIQAIAQSAGWPINSVSARFFNAADPGLAFIKQSKPGFAFASPGFFLKYRQELKLRPLNQVVLRDGATSRYSIIVKSGAPAGLDSLRGKTLAGAPLAEPEFVQRIVLGNKLRLGTDVTIQAMSGLSALRKVSTGEVYAAVIDANERRAMAALPFVGSLAVAYTSAPIPNIGMMAVGDNVAAADIPLMQQACSSLCTSASGAPVCQTFEIIGFAPLDENALNALIKQWEQSR